jgi:hypothetical protein
VTDWLADLHVFCADIGSIPNGRFAWRGRRRSSWRRAP